MGDQDSLILTVLILSTLVLILACHNMVLIISGMWCDLPQKDLSSIPKEVKWNSTAINATGLFFTFYRQAHMTMKW